MRIYKLPSSGSSELELSKRLEPDLIHRLLYHPKYPEQVALSAGKSEIFSVDPQSMKVKKKFPCLGTVKNEVSACPIAFSDAGNRVLVNVGCKLQVIPCTVDSDTKDISLQMSEAVTRMINEADLPKIKQPQEVGETGKFYAYTSSLSPDGKLVAVVLKDRIEICSSSTFKPTGQVIITSSQPSAVVFCPTDPSLLVAGEYSGEVTFHRLLV